MPQQYSETVLGYFESEGIVPEDNYKITIEEQQAMETLLRSPQTPQGLAARAKIVLLTAAGKTADEVTEELRVCLELVSGSQAM